VIDFMSLTQLVRSKSLTPSAFLHQMMMPLALCVVKLFKFDDIVIPLVCDS